MRRAAVEENEIRYAVVELASWPVMDDLVREKKAA